MRNLVCGYLTTFFMKKIQMYQIKFINYHIEIISIAHTIDNFNSVVDM